MKAIRKDFFGLNNEGKEASVYTLENKNGIEARISDFGASLVSLKTPDRYGRLTDIVCGFDCLWDYLNDGGYHGAIAGRVAGRINDGKFTLDGKEYNLCINADKCCLHGGKVGFSHKLWNATPVDGEEPSLVLEYVSPDMEEGFPGTLTIKVTYTLTNNDELKIHYEGTTDKKTIVNLTSHTYYNLNGFASGTVLTHMLWVDSDSYLGTDSRLVPTGEIKPSAGTPFDFSVEKPIGQDIDADDPDLKNGLGYDSCLNLRGGATKEPTHRVTLYAPESGRELKVYTDQPCLQMYAATTMQGERRFKGGYKQSVRTAVALEMQKMNDAINNPHFTDITLDVGEKYEQTTILKFGARK